MIIGQKWSSKRIPSDAGSWGSSNVLSFRSFLRFHGERKMAASLLAWDTTADAVGRVIWKKSDSHINVVG